LVGRGIECLGGLTALSRLALDPRRVGLGRQTLTLCLGFAAVDRLLPSGRLMLRGRGALAVLGGDLGLGLFALDLNTFLVGPGCLLGGQAPALGGQLALFATTSAWSCRWSAAAASAAASCSAWAFS
jgi:hypothetical protein